MTDILDTIDQAIGCQHCGQPLGRSPSPDFCTPSCQQAWHGARSQPLTTYREPYDLPVHVSNAVETQSPETTPGRRTTAGGIYVDVVATADPFPYCPQRWIGPAPAPTITQLDEAHGIVSPGPAIEATQRVAGAVQVTLRGVSEAFERFAEQLRPEIERLRAVGLIADEPDPDPMRRALEFRRQRNTGPQQRQTTPQRINPSRGRVGR